MKKIMLAILMLMCVMLANAQQWIGFDNNSVQAPPQINVVSSDAFNTTLDVEITGYMHEIISVDGYVMMIIQSLDMAQLLKKVSLLYLGYLSC